jgi:hypothetical protein
MRNFYPLRLHRPSCRARLERLLARAHEQRTQVALVLPPRSLASVGLMPAGQGRQMDELSKSLARELHVPIFAPQGPWSNSLFNDNAHFNLRGRQRFDAELRQWWADRK